MLVDRLLDGGDDDLLFLCPDGGVEREHGDTRVGDAEVALQRLGKGADAVGQTLFGNLGYDVLHGHVVGHQAYAERVVEQDGHGLPALGETFLDIARLSCERDALALDIGRMDGSCHQHVKLAVAVIHDGAVERLEGSHAGFLARLAQFHLDFLIKGGQQVHPPVLGILGAVDDAEVGLYVQRLAVIGRHLGRPIDDGRTQFQHLWGGEGFKNQFVSDTVGIAVCNGHTYLSVFFHRVYVVL